MTSLAMLCSECPSLWTGRRLWSRWAAVGQQWCPLLYSALHALNCSAVCPAIHWEESDGWELGSRAGWAQVWVLHCTSTLHWYRGRQLALYRWYSGMVVHWYRRRQVLLVAAAILQWYMRAQVWEWYISAVVQYRSPPEHGLVQWVAHLAVHSSGTHGLVQWVVHFYSELKW